MTSIKGGNFGDYGEIPDFGEGATRVSPEEKKEIRIQRGVTYEVCGREYDELLRALDGFINVNKDVKDGCVIYSASKIKPEDYPVSSIIRGQIRLKHNKLKDNENLFISFSEDLELSHGLEEKLAKLVLRGK